VPETAMTLRSEDLVNSLKYMFKLRSGEGYVDDIDHSATAACVRSTNWRLKNSARASEAQAHGSGAYVAQDPNELGRIAELVNTSQSAARSTSSSAAANCRRSSIRRTRWPSSRNERRLSALGPGGLNRSVPGFEVARRSHLALRPNLPDRNA